MTEQHPSIPGMALVHEMKGSFPWQKISCTCTDPISKMHRVFHCQWIIINPQVFWPWSLLLLMRIQSDRACCNLLNVPFQSLPWCKTLRLSTCICRPSSAPPTEADLEARRQAAVAVCSIPASLYYWKCLAEATQVLGVPKGSHLCATSFFPGQNQFYQWSLASFGLSVLRARECYSSVSAGWSTPDKVWQYSRWQGSQESCCKCSQRARSRCCSKFDSW